MLTFLGNTVMSFLRTAAIAAFAALGAACSPPASTTTTVTTAATTAATTSAAAGDPTAVVRDIYARQLSAHPSSPDAKLVPMTASLLDMVQRSRAITDDEVLDADPVMDANDPGTPVNLSVAADAPPANGHVTVTAQFQQQNDKTTVHYDLVAVNGAWLVDNIRGGSGADMRATLTSELASTTTAKH